RGTEALARAARRRAARRLPARARCVGRARCRSGRPEKWPPGERYGPLPPPWRRRRGCTWSGTRDAYAPSGRLAPPGARPCARRRRAGPPLPPSSASRRRPWLRPDRSDCRTLVVGGSTGNSGGGRRLLHAGNGFEDRIAESLLDVLALLVVERDAVGASGGLELAVDLFRDRLRVQCRHGGLRVRLDDAPLHVRHRGVPLVRASDEAFARQVVELARDVRMRGLEPARRHFGERVAARLRLVEKPFVN